MPKMPKHSSLPNGDIATARAALRAFAREGAREISDLEIDTALRQISRLIYNPLKAGPVAEKAQKTLSELSHTAQEASNILKKLDRQIKAAIKIDDEIEKNDLELSLERFVKYSHIDGQEEHFVREDSDLIIFLIDRLQSFSEKLKLDVNRINDKYSNSGHYNRYNGKTPGSRAVRFCYTLVYNFFGIRGIDLIKKTDLKRNFRNTSFDCSIFYWLVLSVYSFAIKKKYDLYSDEDIFTREIRSLETEDKQKIQDYFAHDIEFKYYIYLPE